MPPTPLPIDDDLYQALNSIAIDQHTSTKQIVQKLIKRYLEEMEDQHDTLLADKAMDELITGDDDTLTLDEWKQRRHALDS
jgi:predicted DNA-binding protein